VASNAQFQQAPSVALAGQIFPWAFYVGAVLFGIALYRGGGRAKYGGAWLGPSAPQAQPAAQPA
jgi:hypothetical protein